MSKIIWCFMLAIYLEGKAKIFIAFPFLVLHLYFHMLHVKYVLSCVYSFGWNEDY